MTERCSSCNRILLWVAGRLRCTNVNCTTGHQPNPTLAAVLDDVFAPLQDAPADEPF